MAKLPYLDILSTSVLPALHNSTFLCLVTQKVLVQITSYEAPYVQPEQSKFTVCMTDY